jgi:hypothetical protein
MAVVWFVAALAVGQTAMAQAVVNLGIVRDNAALSRNVVQDPGATSVISFRQPLAVAGGVDVRVTITFSANTVNDVSRLRINDVRRGTTVDATTVSPAYGASGRVFVATYRLREGDYAIIYTNGLPRRDTINVNVSRTSSIQPRSLQIDIGTRRNDWINQPTAALPAPWNRMVYVDAVAPINPARHTIVIVHGGFFHDPMVVPPSEDQRAALYELAAQLMTFTNREGANILYVDWSSLSRVDGNRFNAMFSGAGLAQEMREAARAVAEQIDELGIANANVSLIGYSWGGSFIGDLGWALRNRGPLARVRNQTNPIRAAIALDPQRIDISGQWDSGWAPYRYDAIASWSVSVVSSGFGSVEMGQSAALSIAVANPPVASWSQQHQEAVNMVRRLVGRWNMGQTPFAGMDRRFAGLTRDYLFGPPSGPTLTVSRGRPIPGGFDMGWEKVMDGWNATIDAVWINPAGTPIVIR